MKAFYKNNFFFIDYIIAKIDYRLTANRQQKLNLVCTFTEYYYKLTRNR